MSDTAIHVASNETGVTVNLGNAQFHFPASLPASFTWLRDRCAGGLHEPTMSKLVAGFMRARPTATFLDIGALFGYFSLLAMTASGGRARVYTFEMNPRTFPALQRVVASNLSAANAERVVLTHAALGDLDAPQRATRFKGFVLEPTAGEGHEAAIDCHTLDSFAAEHGLKADLVKIDVEGFEGKVLAGGAKTLLRDRAVVVMELHDNNLLSRNGITRTALLRRLLADGFRVYHFGQQREAAIDVAMELSAAMIDTNQARLDAAADELVVLASEDIRDVWPHLTLRAA